jgi:hypothetical protein
MRGKHATDLAIPALAAHQHGVVSRSQLRIAGLHDRAIDRRIASGRLHPVHRGVFAVGHTVLTIEGRWMAAVLAGGDSAVLSHASAAPASASTQHHARTGRNDHPPRHPDHHPRPHDHRPRHHAHRPPARTRARPRRPAPPHRLRRTRRTHHRPTGPPRIARPTSAVVPLQRRKHLHPQRTRGTLLRALRRPWPAAPRKQHPHRARGGRLRLAGRAAGRRGRRLPLPPLTERVRGRPRARRGPHRRGLAGPAVHVGEGQRPAGMGRRGRLQTPGAFASV